MAKTKSLTDDVLAKAVTVRNGPATWFSKLPAEVQAELAALKAAWRAGQHDLRKNALARGIHSAVTRRGHQCCNVQGVVRWLDAD